MLCFTCSWYHKLPKNKVWTCPKRVMPLCKCDRNSDLICVKKHKCFTTIFLVTATWGAPVISGRFRVS